MPSPMHMDSVVVFGDSLSDIGRKWKTKSGRMATSINEMYVSPTGRFSDCRNWTDYMIEAATGEPMVKSTADATIAISKIYQSMNQDSRFAMGGGANGFNYANYAEGGACGDTPASKAAFLGTFKGQVDWFEEDIRQARTVLGNTLFFVWFGANDLYTAGRPASQMNIVADVVANTQRARLAEIVRANGGKCRFIFVNLARALTTVRYTRQLGDAEAALLNALGNGRPVPSQGAGRASLLWQAQQALDIATARRITAGHFSSSARAVKNLQEKVNIIKEFEKGVMNYNSHLSTYAAQKGDAVAEVGNILSEETLSRLFDGNYGLMAGALAKATKTHTGALDHDAATRAGTSGAGIMTRHAVTAKDEVHPTDQMYKLIWGEIREVIRSSGATFGNLEGMRQGKAFSADLMGLSGPNGAVRGQLGSVLDDIKGGNFRLRPTAPT